MESDDTSRKKAIEAIRKNKLPDIDWGPFKYHVAAFNDGIDTAISSLSVYFSATDVIEDVRCRELDFSEHKAIIKSAIDDANTPAEVLEKIIDNAYRFGVQIAEKRLNNHDGEKTRQKNNEMEVITMKNNLKELLDQATILAGKKTNEDVAEYLSANNVLVPPVKLGDTVYYLSVRSTFGGLLTSGVVVERTVDCIAFDGKFMIKSFTERPGDPVGNLYAYWGEKVFASEDDAVKALDEMRRKAGVK